MNSMHRHPWTDWFNLTFFLPLVVFVGVDFIKRKRGFVCEINYQQGSLHYTHLFCLFTSLYRLGRLGRGWLMADRAFKLQNKMPGSGSGWFSLESGVLDKSSSFTLVIIVIASLLWELSILYYIRREQNYNTWILWSMKKEMCKHTSVYTSTRGFQLCCTHRRVSNTGMQGISMRGLRDLKQC